MLSASEVSRRLAQSAESVCRHLLPGGKPALGDWICGDVTGNAGKSLKIELSGAHAGKWRDWGDNEEMRGDLLDLWRHVKGVPLADAIREAKTFLGISDPVPQSQRSYATPSKNGTKALREDGGAWKWLTDERKLRGEIVNRFQVTGEPEKKAIVFPSYDVSGKHLLNRSYRALKLDAKGKKVVWQDTGCAPALFGWHALDDSAFTKRTVLLCEGQIDAMTWTQWGVPALSIPNGNGLTWIEYEWDNLAAFDTIYISFDMDGKTAETARKAIERLGKHRCLIVELPEKDANDCLKKGSQTEDAVKWISAAQSPPFKNLVKAIDLERRVIASLVPTVEPFTLPFFRGQWPHSGFYPRPEEVSVWTGMTSHGKSAILNFLALTLAATQRTVFIASMEMKAENLLRRMVSAFFGNVNPSPDTVSDFLKECGHNLIFADVVGYIEQGLLFEMMRFAFARYDASHFIIDSLMRVEGLEEEYVEQGRFLNKLQEFAKQSGAHVHLVAHPRKLREDGRPGKMDVKGSSLIPNNADNILSVNRNQEKERLKKSGELTPTQAREMWDTEVRVEKQRETGWEGAFFLRFDSRTYSFAAIKPPTKDNQ